MRKIKVGIVNYLNTAPLVYGLQNSSIINKIELIPDYPANLARDLKDGRIDLGLVPVAIIPSLETWSIVGNYCIGADGPVASVGIFSEVPIEEIKTVLLDYQSRTSVALAKILLKDYWKLDVEFVNGREDFHKQIKGSVAGVVIGDRALEMRRNVPFIYDLGEAWKKHTGLPFVFAAWIGNKEFSEEFIDEFNKANAYGLQHLPEVLAEHPYDVFNLKEYYTKYIKYELDAEK
ncbi:MAG: menaquinone biosynthesis protein, partial [Chitinophagaceae bacterium]|nr:menaquinone biosynthesis protein [Chitinophagaceae bacterium]